MTQADIELLLASGILRISGCQDNWYTYELTHLGRVLLQRGIDASEQEDERLSGTHPVGRDGTSEGMGTTSQRAKPHNSFNR